MLLCNLITLDSHRRIDSNGYMVVKDNPIAKAGVFEYFGHEIGAEIPDKIYKVYRPFDELVKIKDTFSGKPIILEHEWIEPDNLPAIRGAVGGEIRAEYPYLVADLTIYDGEAAEAIKSGNYQELSPGYLSDYIQENGVTDDGEEYDYKQSNIRFNHLALVEQGRSGKDLKVLDGKALINKDKKGVCESMEEREKTMQQETCDEDKRKLIDEIAAIAAKSAEDFDGGEDEKIKTIVGIAEKLAYEPSEAEEHTDDEAADDDESEEVREDEPSEDDDEEAESGNKVEELKRSFAAFAQAFQGFLGEEAGEEAHQSEDVLPAIGRAVGAVAAAATGEKTQDSFKRLEKAVISKVSASQRAYDEVMPYTGKMNIYTKDGIMGEKEIYKYAYKCVGGNCSGVSDYKSAFKAYIAAKSANSNKAKTFDSAAVRSEIKDFLSKVK